uniref:DNA-3-methyladenine glycosylase family protein n=1 Tax=Candidatus Electrothrix sp. TaxID=2170559 RepID=UPI0040571BBC
MSSWTLKSIPPHDWFICLDIDPYFDHEHEPEKIFEEGFTRPIPLKERDIIATIFFNGDPESPEFHIETPEDLTKDEIHQANDTLARILGTGLDLRPLYEQAENDPVLGPKLKEYYGLKRMARGTLLEDIIYRIVQMQLSHKPTAKKMAFKMREAYGTHLTHKGKTLPAWPRPLQLAKADPAQIRKMGPTLRKGEYLAGLAQDILAGEVDMDWLDEKASPQEFYDTISKVRGVGPTSAQDLMLFRERTDAVFPSNIKKGEEKGLRKWIIISYGGDPTDTSEKQFQKMISNWQGYEAAAIEFLFVDYMIGRKKKK